MVLAQTQSKIQGLEGQGEGAFASDVAQQLDSDVFVRGIVRGAPPRHWRDGHSSDPSRRSTRNDYELDRVELEMHSGGSGRDEHSFAHEPRRISSENESTNHGGSSLPVGGLRNSRRDMFQAENGSNH